MDNITALTVFYKTPTLIDISLRPFRRFYPDTNLVIVNNSPEDDECTKDLTEFVVNDKFSKLIQLDLNYGHGPGLNRGMTYVKTPYVYIFDSDIGITKENFLQTMFASMNTENYGIGYTRYTSRGGQNSNSTNLEDPNIMNYLHPMACIISMAKYEEFPKFHSGGAPFCKTMSAIKDTNNSDVLIKSFPVLAGYVRHHGGSTRARYGIHSPYIGY